jgi:hypothetical protein
MSEGNGEGITTGDGTGEKPAWLAQMPADLKDNQTFSSFKTIGELGKSYLELSGKVKEVDALKTKLDSSIPKLSDKATDEEKAAYYKAIGRPDKADEYEFAGDGMDPKIVGWAKDTFFKNGLSKEQAKNIQASFNDFVTASENARVETMKAEATAAEEKLKTELGDKYPEQIELAKRTWQKLSDAEFDSFVNETKIGNDARMIRFILKVAKLTGEDKSPAASPSKGATGTGNQFTDFYKAIEVKK